MRYTRAASPHTTIRNSATIISTLHRGNAGDARHIRRPEPRPPEGHSTAAPHRTVRGGGSAGRPPPPAGVPPPPGAVRNRGGGQPQRGEPDAILTERVRHGIGDGGAQSRIAALPEPAQSERVRRGGDLVIEAFDRRDVRRQRERVVHEGAGEKLSGRVVPEC